MELWTDRVLSQGELRMTKNRRPTFVMPLALVGFAVACGSPPEPRAATSEDATPSVSSSTPSPARTPAKYRVNASPPEGERKFVLSVQSCQGACTAWTPAVDVPVYKCWTSERGGVFVCKGDDLLMRVGITDAEGKLRTENPPATLGIQPRVVQKVVWKVFIPKDTSSPLYRTEAAGTVVFDFADERTFSKESWRQLGMDEHRRAWKELRVGLAEVAELRFDETFMAQAYDVEHGQREAARANDARTLQGSLALAVAQCRTAPTEAECNDMIERVRQHGTGELRAEAEGVFDTYRWNVASPSCSAPKSSGSCDAVKAYLSRYPNGLHASEAQRALSRAAPALERLARAEHEAAAEWQRQHGGERQGDGERQRVKEVCLGQCRAAGNKSEYECSLRCDR